MKEFDFVNDFKMCYVDEILLKLHDSKKLVYFGASEGGKKFYEMLDKKGIKPDYFCDNNKSKSGKTFLGVKILSFDELCNMDRDISIFITSQYIDEIYKQLVSEGFKNVYFMKNLYQLDIKEYFEVDYIKENINKIEELYNLLSDKKSQKNLINLIKHRLSGDLKYVDESCDINLYFEEEGFITKSIDSNFVPYNEIYFKEDDIIEFSKNETFIDGGAYIGDTATAFARKVNNRFNMIYSFEPEIKNYEKLKGNIDRQSYRDKVEVMNLGLFNQNTDLNFFNNEEMLMSSEVRKNGTEKIKVIALDDFFKDKKAPITFIKMDIEGSEHEALEGSKMLINKYKPKLAICIYHKPSDLWELPLYIHELCPDYKLYIRHYDKIGTFETVCYATL